MLRVTTIYASTAAKSAAYYTKYLTGAPGEVPGVWSGRQSAAFGLSGNVDTESLTRLLEGRDPVSGTRLGRALVDRVTRRWAGGEGGVGVRCDVLGAQVGERVVGADRRQTVPRSP